MKRILSPFILQFPFLVFTKNVHKLWCKKPAKCWVESLLFLLCTVGFTPAGAQNILSKNNFEKLSLNKGWRFHLGDVAFPVVKGHSASYTNAKAGRANGAAAPNYDDKSWRLLNLPHDWASESVYDSTENLSQGYRKRGFGWYRRQFKLDSADRGKHLEIQLEGIATYATIWVNGSVVHRNWCGYTSSYIDITAFAKYGDQPNTIVVRVDANAQEGWWYEGAGIYRNTWLIKRAALHVITDGLFANPIKVKGDSWKIPGEVTLENSGQYVGEAEMELSLWNAAGQLLSKKVVPVSLQALEIKAIKLDLQLDHPKLWSVDKPVLYRVKTILKKKGIIIDSASVACGFRTIRFDADSGFFLNEKPIKLQGVCNHQDHAGVGVAVPDAIVEFRLKKLKEMGVNAYRCAHNPPSVAFLDLCDRMGILVMDENRNFNSSPEYIKQLQWLIRRDRNHPSVILWSVFNEEPMQGTEVGFEMVRRMRDEVRKLDTTRAVTAAMNGGLFDQINVAQAVDVVGFNYQDYAYDRFHKENPKTPVTSSEDVSGFMVRGAYKTDTAKHILDSYDTQFAEWGTSHRKGWKVIAERPYMAGAFIWTGFDYHGEPSPFGWPSASSFFGIMDLCGFPKMAFYLHQAQWVKDKPILHLVPDWNWPTDSIGKKIKVMALSNAETVKLMLNGKLVGEQKVDPYEMNTWQVPYQPGRLEAIGLREGKEVSRYHVETTGVPVKLLLTPDRNIIAGDGVDAMPITVQALDAKGRPVPNANFNITFEIHGYGTIIGLGNGNPNSHEAEKGNNRNLFNGLAQLIIQSKEASREELVTIIATAKGLQQAKLTIPVKLTSIRAYLPVMESGTLIDTWLISKMTNGRPDVTVGLAENDMNSWVPTGAGKLQQMTAKYVMFRTEIKQTSAQISNGSTLIFKQLTGKAEIWGDGALLGQKTVANPSDYTIHLPAGKLYQSIVVLIESVPHLDAGLGGAVVLN